MDQFLSILKKIPPIVLLLLLTACGDPARLLPTPTDPSKPSKPTKPDPDKTTNYDLHEILLQEDICTPILNDLEGQLNEVSFRLDGAIDRSRQAFIMNDYFLELNDELQTLLTEIDTILTTSVATTDLTPLFTGTGSQIEVQNSPTTLFTCFDPSNYILSLTSLNIDGTSFADQASANDAINKLSDALWVIKQKKSVAHAAAKQSSSLFGQISFLKDTINEFSEAVTANIIGLNSSVNLTSLLRDIREDYLTYTEAPFLRENSLKHVLLLANIAALRDIMNVTLFPEDNPMLNGTGIDFPAKGSAPAYLAADYNMQPLVDIFTGVANHDDLTAEMIETGFGLACDVATMRNQWRQPAVLESSNGYGPGDYEAFCYSISTNNHATTCSDIAQTAKGALQTVEFTMERMRDLASAASNPMMDPAERNSIIEESDALKLDIINTIQTSSYNEQILLNNNTNIANLTINNEAAPCLDLAEVSSSDIITEINDYNLATALEASNSITLTQSLLEKIQIRTAKTDGTLTRTTNYSNMLDNVLITAMNDYFSNANGYLGRPFVRTANFCETSKKMAHASLLEISNRLNRLLTLAVQSGNGSYNDHDRALIVIDANSNLQVIDEVTAMSRFFDQKLLLGGQVSHESENCYAPINASTQALNIDTIDLSTEIDANNAIATINSAISTVNSMISSVEP
jgi:flagellin-like hook-associated protein FlgL